MFKGIFDLDRDGNTDSFEIAFGLSIVFNEDNDERDADDFDDEEDSDLSSEYCNDYLEEKLEALEEQLSELEEKLSDLEYDEPEDFTSAAYERWERHKDLLEEEISEIEDQISEIEDQME
jgi:predicted  nucleic acid-binding Zn-ribbon protein